jgi:hypothetical protein
MSSGLRMGLAGLALGLALAVVGCGGSAQTISGTVTLDNAPVEDGHIAFVPEGRGTSAGGTISKGKYSCQVPRGKYRVEINASKMMPLPPGQKGMYGDKEEMRQYIPEKYNNKSELTADVTGPATLNYDLKSK